MFPRLTIGALVILLLGAISNAQTTSRADDAMAHVERITKDYNRAQEAWNARYSAAKTDADRQKLMAEYPSSDEAVAKLGAVAKASPATPAALSALTWIISQRGSADDWVYDALARDFATERFAHRLIIPQLQYARGEGPERVLRAIVEKNTDRTSKEMAQLVLGVHQAQRSQDPAFQSEADKLTREAEEILEAVVSQNHNSAFVAQAKSQLFEIRNLAIGKTAPEITGADVQDKPLRLSDFRGKVVVLDFFGDW